MSLCASPPLLSDDPPGLISDHRGISIFNANAHLYSREQIGSVPTPWPSWLIAAHPTRAPAEALRPFLATLSEHVRAFDAAEQRAGPDVAFIKDKFGYPEADIQVRFPSLSCAVGWR